MKRQNNSQQNKNIPLLDCPFDYLIGDASGRVMNEYACFPCKIQCGVYAIIVRGSAKATINITQYDFAENDFLRIDPGSFLLIHEFSPDALVYYVLFSSSFVERNAFNARININPLQLRVPVVHLSSEHAKVYKDLLQLLMDASNCEPSLLSSAKMVHVANLFQTGYIEMMDADKNMYIKPQDRKQEIYQIYIKLVLEHYAQWHQVAKYAEEMRITLPHLCSTIKSVCGKTAGDLIIDAIITDAKAQLKITNLAIKEIAINLGFENVAFFNRFFKAHTGVTPKCYRNDE